MIDLIWPSRYHRYPYTEPAADQHEGHDDDRPPHDPLAGAAPALAPSARDRPDRGRGGTRAPPVGLVRPPRRRPCRTSGAPAADAAVGAEAGVARGRRASGTGRQVGGRVQARVADQLASSRVPYHEEDGAP